LSRFDDALARADAAQLATHGDSVTFRDPTGDKPDCDVVIVFGERDVPEPPNSMGVSKGQYSSAWTRLSQFPVENPTGYQLLISDLEVYWIREATADGGGAVNMKLHKVKAPA
jgi:hypothetical protein